MLKFLYKKKKVMAFGVFDFLHQGHIYFLKQAKKLGGELVVSIARDANVFEFKGHLPVFPEKERLQSVKDLNFVKKAVLGGMDNPWKHIKEENPNIIALGYDQNPYLARNIKQLKNMLKEQGMQTDVVRIKSYKPEKFKAGKLRQISGRVVKNIGRGRKLGFPTANLGVDENFPEGIFAAVTVIASKQKRVEQPLPSLLFVGSALTFEENQKKAEVYILDFDGDLYNKTLKVEVLRKLRDNKKFKSQKELISVMQNDELLARKYFKSYNGEK